MILLLQTHHSQWVGCFLWYLLLAGSWDTSLSFADRPMAIPSFRRQPRPQHSGSWHYSRPGQKFTRITTNLVPQRYTNAFNNYNIINNNNNNNNRVWLGLAGGGGRNNVNASNDELKESQGCEATLRASKELDLKRFHNIINSRPKLVGRSILLLVSFLYGTLHVCLRRVYALDNPPTAPALSAVRGWMAALCFSRVFLSKNNSQDALSETTTSSDTTGTESEDAPQALKPNRSLLWFTAFDLALWNFLAQGLVNIGLRYCSSARASFLTQSSVIITPLMALGAGHAIPPSLWTGVGLAFAGLCILSLWPSAPAATSAAAAAAAAASSGGSFSSGILGMIRQLWNSVHPGDGLVLAGAVSWSVYLVRLSRASSPKNNKYGIDFPALPLQAIKTLLLAIMYTCWWMIHSCYSSSSSKTAAAITTAAPWWTSGAAWLWLFLSAIGPGALADVLQQQGQKHVSAAETNIILSAEPVFAAVCAFALLGETVSGREMMGGGLILLAAFISSLSS